MKLIIDAESVALLRGIFTQPQRWTTRTDPEEGRRRRYDVFFPALHYRQSAWGLGARLKVRRVPKEVWERGARLGIYRQDNAERGSANWKHWPSLVLYPLPEHCPSPRITLGWTGVFWGKSGTFAAGAAGGMRCLRDPDDPRCVLIHMPGSSGRCYKEFIIGPAGAMASRDCTYPRSPASTESIELTQRVID